MGQGAKHDQGHDQGQGQDRPHNAQDGRCRYTLGAERCPAPGVVRVGQWWVCRLHEEWATNPKDAGLAEEGRVALRMQRERHGTQAETPSVDVRATQPGGAQGVGHGAADESPRERHWREVNAMLEGGPERERRQRRERIASRAEALFVRRVRELKAGGTDARAAVVAAVREVAVAAVEQRWGTGR